MLMKRHDARHSGLGRTCFGRNVPGTHALPFNDIDAAQLRKLAHARATVRREPWTPALGSGAFAARLDRQCGTQYRADFIVSEGLRFARLSFLGTFTRQPTKGLREISFSSTAQV